MSHACKDFYNTKNSPCPLALYLILSSSRIVSFLTFYFFPLLLKLQSVMIPSSDFVVCAVVQLIQQAQCGQIFFQLALKCFLVNILFQSAFFVSSQATEQHTRGNPSGTQSPSKSLYNTPSLSS